MLQLFYLDSSSPIVFFLIKTGGAEHPYSASLKIENSFTREQKNRGGGELGEKKRKKEKKTRNDQEKC